MSGITLGPDPKALRVVLPASGTFSATIALQTPGGEPIVVDDDSSVVLYLGLVEVTATKNEGDLTFTLTAVEVAAVLAAPSRAASIWLITPTQRIPWFQGSITS